MHRPGTAVDGVRGRGADVRGPVAGGLSPQVRQWHRGTAPKLRAQELVLGPQKLDLGGTCVTSTGGLCCQQAPPRARHTQHPTQHSTTRPPQGGGGGGDPCTGVHCFQHKQPPGQQQHQTWVQAQCPTHLLPQVINKLLLGVDVDGWLVLDVARTGGVVECVEGFFQVHLAR